MLATCYSSMQSYFKIDLIDLILTMLLNVYFSVYFGLFQMVICISGPAVE